MCPDAKAFRTGGARGGGGGRGRYLGKLRESYRE